MKKDKIILIIALIVVCLFMYYLNAHTTIFHDEFVYSCIYCTTDRISNLKDIVVSTYNLYQMHNGRAITHMLLMVCLLLPKFVRDILNSIFITTLLAELIYFSTRENKSGIQKITFIFFTIFLFWRTAPSFGETIMWFSGAVNYMWTSVFLLLYIVLVEKIFNQEKEYDHIKKILFIISSFILASTHEIVAVIMISYIGLIWLYLLIKNRKINKTILYGIISAILGFLFIILSPGTNVRKQVNLQTTDVIVTLAQRIINCINVLVISMKENIFLVIAIFIMALIVLLIKKFKNKTGIEFEIITQAKETELTVKGTIKNIKDKVAVFVGGGGSTEIAICKNGIIETANTKIGVADIMNKYPDLAEDFATTELDTIKEIVRENLSFPKQKSDILILTGGGHLNFALNSGVNYVENNLYNDDFHPIMMDIEMRKTDTVRYYKEISLDDIRKRVKDPDWWYSTRAMCAFVLVVAEEIGAKYIIPTDISLAHGLINN